METFTKLFGSLLVFVYHCFDRIVINGYLSGLSRPEQVVYFFREVLGVPVVDKEVLGQRTNEYQSWVEAYARNHKIPIQWAEKGVRKEDYVLPASAGAWRSRTAMASTSFSRAWNRAGPSAAHRAQSIRPRTRTTAFWHSSAAASRITISTFAMRSWVRSSIRVASFLPVPDHLLSQRPFLHRTGIEPRRKSASARTTTPSWPWTMRRRCKRPPTG